MTHAGNAAQLGHAPHLGDRDADTGEEGQRLLRNRGRTRHRPPELVQSQLGTQLGQHQLVGLGPFGGHVIGKSLAGDQRRGTFPGNRHGPLQSLALGLVLLVGDGEFDCRFELFPDPGHGAPDGRARVGQRRRNRASIGDHRDLGSEHLLVVQRHRAVGDVRRRQKGGGPITELNAQNGFEGLGLEQQVGVRHLHPFGISRRPGGVDEGDHIVGLHRPPGRLEIKVFVAGGVEIVQRERAFRGTVDADDVLQLSRHWPGSGRRIAPRRSPLWCRHCRKRRSVVRRAACCTPRTRWRRGAAHPLPAGRTRCGWPSSAKPCRRGGPRGRPGRPRPGARRPRTRRQVIVWVSPGVRSATASGSIAALRWNASHSVVGGSEVVFESLTQPRLVREYVAGVTSLTAEAASFFSCRVGMMGQSGPQDVACGVFVCRCGVTAALAGEFRLRDAVRARCVPAALTPVGGVPGVDLNPSPPSLFRFGAQYRDELTPASVTDRSVEPGLRPSTIGR